MAVKKKLEAITITSDIYFDAFIDEDFIHIDSFEKYKFIFVRARKQIDVGKYH